MLGQHTRRIFGIFVTLILVATAILIMSHSALAVTQKDNVSITLRILPSSVSSGGTYSVSGILTDTSNGQPLSSKTITFFATSPITIPNTTTDSNGNYLVSGLTAPSTAGSYSITAKFSGGTLYNTMSTAKTLTVS